MKNEKKNSWILRRCIEKGDYCQVAVGVWRVSGGHRRASGCSWSNQAQYHPILPQPPTQQPELAASASFSSRETGLRIVGEPVRECKGELAFSLTHTHPLFVSLPLLLDHFLYCCLNWSVMWHFMFCLWQEKVNLPAAALTGPLCNVSYA